MKKCYGFFFSFHRQDLQHNHNNIDRVDKQNFDPYILRSGYFDNTYATKKKLERPDFKNIYGKICQ